MAYLARGRRARVARMETLTPPRPTGGPTIGDMPHANVLVRLVAVLLDPDASPDEQGLAAEKAYALIQDRPVDPTALVDYVIATERSLGTEPDQEWLDAVLLRWTARNERSSS